MREREAVPAGAPRAFVDSSAFLALLNRRDQWHREAVGIQQRLVPEAWRLVTTNFVVAEAHGLILGRLGYEAARRFLATVPESTVTVVRVTPGDERRAREIIFRHHNKDFSLVDALSFAVMERLRIPVAFTFDRHFLQYGFSVLGAIERS